MIRIALQQDTLTATVRITKTCAGSDGEASVLGSRILPPEQLASTPAPPLTYYQQPDRRYETRSKIRVGEIIFEWHTESVNDYERIAQLIRYLDKHYTDQPDLAVLAKQTGLSAFHFHRLFSTWAGVTPKDFLRCLTLEHIKRSLETGSNVLDAAFDAGLSSPGRAHDLCISVEAATPGELKSGGAGWAIVAGFGSSPFGTCLIAESPRGICHLAFLESGEEDAAWSELQANWPKARLQRSDTAASRLARQIFLERAKNRERITLKAFLRGTPFQLRVWRALLRIPSGRITTYGRLAAAIEHPTASRAVGSAVGANSLAYLIPCHRVIRETGVLGEYRWGKIRKRAMFAWEGLRPECGGPRPQRH